MTQALNGWLVLDKPKGISSAHAINKLKRFVRPSKIGHAGTLDPFASGVLLVAIGEATKLTQYAMANIKSYIFTVKWGESTDTLDITGNVTAVSSKIPSLEEIQNILPRYVGTLQQTPPAFSAININGKRAYQLARKGVSFNILPKTITINKLNILSSQGNFTTFSLDCGKGVYVRSLARDLAADLGTYGFVSELARARSGKFLLSDTILLASLEEIVHNDQRIEIKQFLKPLNAVLDDILVHHIDEVSSLHLRQGKKIVTQISYVPGVTIAVLCNDILIAMCVAEEENLLQPVRVFNNNMEG